MLCSCGEREGAMLVLGDLLDHAVELGARRDRDRGCGRGRARRAVGDRVDARPANQSRRAPEVDGAPPLGAIREATWHSEVSSAITAKQVSRPKTRATCISANPGLRCSVRWRVRRLRHASGMALALPVLVGVLGDRVGWLVARRLGLELGSGCVQRLARLGVDLRDLGVDPHEGAH